MKNLVNPYWLQLLINALINCSSVSVSTSIEAEVLSVCCSGAFRCVLTQCQGGKTPAMILEKLPINLGRVLRPFPNYLEFNILQRERLFTCGKHSGQLSYLSRSGRPSKFTPRSECAMLRETLKNPRATSQTLQAEKTSWINLRECLLNMMMSWHIWYCVSLLQAHKALLATQSDYFRVMFTADMRERDQDKIHMKGLTAAGFGHILRFMYYGSLELSMPTVQEILQVTLELSERSAGSCEVLFLTQSWWRDSSCSLFRQAAMYVQLTEAVEFCCSFLLAKICLENCAEVMRLLEDFSVGVEGVQEQLDNFLLDNFVPLMSRPDFLSYLSLERLQVRQNAAFTSMLRHTYAFSVSTCLSLIIQSDSYPTPHVQPLTDYVCVEYVLKQASWADSLVKFSQYDALKK